MWQLLGPQAVYVTDNSWRLEGGPLAFIQEASIPAHGFLPGQGLDSTGPSQSCLGISPSPLPSPPPNSLSWFFLLSNVHSSPRFKDSLLPTPTPQIPNNVFSLISFSGPDRECRWWSWSRSRSRSGWRSSRGDSPGTSLSSYWHSDACRWRPPPRCTALQAKNND